MILSDAELILNYRQSGNLALVGDLFKRHTAFTYGVCMKYLKNEDDCNDAVMQIFEKLITDLRKHEVENFRPWLHMVARNYCLMQLRSRKTSTGNTVSIDENFTGNMELSSNMHPEDDKEIMLEHVDEALKTLNEKQRICIDLFYLQQLSYEEVAAKTGFSMNEVKSFIQNGKRNLKIAITKRMDETMTLFLTLLFYYW